MSKKNTVYRMSRVKLNIRKRLNMTDNEFYQYFMTKYGEDPSRENIMKHIDIYGLC